MADVQSTKLNDCWLIASLQIIAQRCPQFMCIPRLDNFKGARCVKMTLNIAGKAVEVIASAKLPTRADLSRPQHNEYVLKYAHASSTRPAGLDGEWGAVLEQHGRVLWAAVVERLVAAAYGEVWQSTSVRPSYKVSLPTRGRHLCT